MLSAKKLIVIRSNGRKHWFSDEVTYRRIEQRFDDNNTLIFQSCMNPGPEHCPAIGLVSLGYFNGNQGIQVSGEEIFEFAKSQFKNKTSGKAFYKGIFVAWRNVEVITYEDGKEDFEYQLFISDEIKTSSDFSYFH